MNIEFIAYIMGWVMTIESVSMLLPCIVSLVYHESQGLVYLIIALIFGIFGAIVIRKKPEKQQFFARDGFAVVALSWILLSIIGCLPFLITGEIPSVIDALFETVSGFTTTGASILDDVEAMSHTGLFWRSFSHWIGGMGVIVFILSIMPLTGGSNIHLMRAESPGPSVSKLVPKMSDTAKILYIIYTAMTLTLMVALLIAGMPVFDSIITAIGTAGTGGFGIKGDSIASYNDACKWIVSVGMLMFGINFNFYFFILGKNKKEAFKIEEVRWYLLFILLATVVITFNIKDIYGSVYAGAREAFFQVCSLVTSTGFATADFDQWSVLCKTILVGLMFMGACAGSTGGGIKVSRIVIMAKAVFQEMETMIHPRVVRSVSLDEKKIDNTMVKSVLVFIGTYAFLFVISMLAISLDGNDLETNFTAVVACLSNIGPGLSKVGPTCNFNCFTGFSKGVLIFDMLAGRLELFPLLILFSPKLWKRK